jgi:hypothetical protein
MTSFVGLRVVSGLIALLAGASLARAQGSCVITGHDPRSVPACNGSGQPSTPMSAVAFDAIFYRAASGLGNAYVENGFAGFSLRPLPVELSDGQLRGIRHTGAQTCRDVSLSVTANSQQALALADCTTQCCHADCTAFAHKSQRTSTSSDALRTVEKPGPCSAEDCTSGLTCVAFTADASRNLADDKARLRPGDDCESAGHTALLISRVAGDSWKTWEARGEDYGVVPHQRNIETEMLHGDNTSPPCPTNTRGCWRPVTERTTAPTNIALFIPATSTNMERKLADGETVTGDDANTLVLKWEQPARFPALADYLVWIQWSDNGQPKHRIFRVPAFTQRWQPPDVRLADFPNATGMTTVSNAQVRVPLDETDAGVIRVPLSRVTRFFDPQEFKQPDNRMDPTATFGAGLVPCAPTLPALRSAEAVCDNQAFQVAEASWSAILAQPAPPRTYSVQIRVERYGQPDDDATHFNRRTVVGACPKINNDFDPDCLDPEWSAPQTFSIAGPPCPVSLSVASPSVVTCDLSAGKWVVDPASVTGCISGTCPNGTSTQFGYAFGELPAGVQGPVVGCGDFSVRSSNCGAATAAEQAACTTGHCGCVGTYGFTGPAKIEIGLLTPVCSSGSPPTSYQGNESFNIVNCATPSARNLPGCR